MAISHLVALGSSFAAGPGIEPVVDRAAGRSGRNYAHVLAARLGAELTDLTVSGATTETILTRPQRTLLRRFAPQIEGIPPTADLVTVTAGGNDLGYLGSIMRSAWAGWLREQRLTRRVGDRLAGRARPVVSDGQVEEATRGLVRVVGEVRRRAPGARILLVDYLTILGPHSRPDRLTSLDQLSVDAFGELGDRLAGVFAAAATRADAELVRCSTLSLDHAVGSPQPWVNGFVRPWSRGGAAFHPNAAGMAAVADEIGRVLGD